MNSLEKKQTISLDSIAVANGELVAANLNGEVVILGFISESYYSLDQVGVFVWDLLQEPRKVSEIRDAIIREYDVEPAQCERDLIALLVDLAEKHLIDIINEPAT